MVKDISNYEVELFILQKAVEQHKRAETDPQLKANKCAKEIDISEVLAEITGESGASLEYMANFWIEKLAPPGKPPRGPLRRCSNTNLNKSTHIFHARAFVNPHSKETATPAWDRIQELKRILTNEKQKANTGNIRKIDARNVKVKRNSSNTSLKSASSNSNKSEKLALVIAVENYQNKSIPQVKFAANDANAFADALRLIGFKNRNLIILINENATKTTIDSHIAALSRRLKEYDLFILFYAGHGFRSAAGATYITCFDLQDYNAEGSSIKLSELFTVLDICTCERILLFLDSCHTGLKIHEYARDLYLGMSHEEMENFCSKSQYCVAFASCIVMFQGNWTHL